MFQVQVEMAEQNSRDFRFKFQSREDASENIRRRAGVKSYRDLEIYKMSYKLAIELHKMSLKLPQYEMYEEGAN